MRDLRVVFMGTPEFAVTILDNILDKGYDVIGVITAPDKPAGRGRKLQQSAVKEFAVSKGLTVLQPTNLKSPEFVQELKALNPNVQVVVAFRMLPEVIWKLPEYGTFNLHASLLPQYRGAAPINWSIINGETSTGVSTFFIDEKIDTGEIILSKKVAINRDENVGDLHDKLMHAGADLVTETLEGLKMGPVPTQKQNTSGKLKEAPKLTKENTKIDWFAPVEEIYNLIRGLNPYPGAWCYLKNNGETISIKVYKASYENKSHNEEIGKIVKEDKKMKIFVNGGLINLLEIQLPGKRKMEIEDLLNGYQLENNAVVL
jgi:methionyl-tRNA formyltransferase